MSQFISPLGINFSTETLTAPIMAQVLCRTVSFLQTIETHDARLQQYADWWEHDGLHFEKGELDIPHLFKLVESPRSLLEAMSDDHAVFIGIAPKIASWYLRFRLYWDDEGYALKDRFGITLPVGLAARSRQEVLVMQPLAMNEEDAASYYQRLMH